MTYWTAGILARTLHRNGLALNGRPRTVPQLA
jgi:hypothetical protein